MRTIEEHKQNIQNFADEFKITFERNGEVGFGRECVGLLKGSSYIDYNPLNMNTYEPIEEFYNKQLAGIAPENAYHKHDCLAVLGTTDESIIELSEWVDKLRELNVTIEKYSTGAIGMQALVSGSQGYAIKVP